MNKSLQVEKNRDANGNFGRKVRREPRTTAIDTKVALDLELSTAFTKYGGKMIERLARIAGEGAETSEALVATKIFSGLVLQTAKLDMALSLTGEE